MPAEFVPLSDLLRANITVPVDPADEADGSTDDLKGSFDAAPRSTTEAPASAASVAYDEAVGAALRDLRLFRARLADALDESVARMLRDLAADVLVRELRLAPCDVRALVQRALTCAPLVRIRLAPDDAARLGRVANGVDIVSDVSLAAGDVVVEVVGGVLDLRLGVRLADMLEAFA
ncbi:MAG: hypothetical protein JO103_00330 [Candidatus Eremiobacteraeota bacterium]|nr:hypothetical protein [Candidatus Eremiobacteraeota bacterium]MBV9408999.1 hypothetical protein [Candidatus Eremiobacteraeota bacterium]